MTTIRIVSTKLISTAPARICLFGDHQDYLNLPIIACAIDRKIEIRAEENGSNYLKINLQDLNKVEEVNFTEDLPQAKNGDFIRLALQVLRRYNCIPDKGYDIQISGDIPVNAGLSSSSAFTVGWIQFLVNAFGIDEKITPQLLARLAYETEVIEQGSSGGKMDQYTIGIGEMIYLNTLDDQVEKINADLSNLIIGVSGVAKDTFGTLAMLKKNAWASIELAKEHQPDFDIQTADLEEMKNLLPLVDESLRKTFEAAVGNHVITQKAKIELLKPTIDLAMLGKLMNDHHSYLRDNLRITVPRIDAMIDGAMGAGALGAKIVGSGGGGCIVALTDGGTTSAVIQAIKAAGAIDAFVVKVAKGAHFQIES